MSPDDRARLFFLGALERRADAIRREALALTDDDFIPMPDATKYGEGAWSICALKLDHYADDFPDAALARNRLRCPATWATLAPLRGLVVAGIMRLAPRAEIPLHEDHREDDVIRCHLGLRLPPEQRAYWPEGRARLMDIRRPHSVSNRCDQARLTLCCDFQLDSVFTGDALPPWNPPQPG